MTPVPVPPTPTGCTVAPAGVIPGEVVRWRLNRPPHAVTLVLGVTTIDADAGPAWGWVQIHAGPATGGTGTLGADALEDLAAALDAARAFTQQEFPGRLQRPEPEPEPETDDGQMSLLETGL